MLRVRGLTHHSVGAGASRARRAPRVGIAISALVAALALLLAIADQPRAVIAAGAGSAAHGPIAPAEASADYPVRIQIPRLGVDHWLEARGVTNGHLEEPYDGVNAIAWYSDYGAPGPGGNSVYSAHETWNRRHGPFYWLHAAGPGDEVWVEMASGGWWLYHVFSNERYDAETMPMAEIIWPNVPDEEEWVTFFTCGGQFVRLPSGYWEYLERDVVIAKRMRYVTP
jgi:hypothetical protein